MQAFIDNLLDLRKFKDGNFSLEKEMFDFNQMMSVVCNIFDPICASKGVHLEVKLERDLATPKSMLIDNDISMRSFHSSLSQQNTTPLQRHQNLSASLTTLTAVPKLVGDRKRL